MKNLIQILSHTSGSILPATRKQVERVSRPKSGICPICSHDLNHGICPNCNQGVKKFEKYKKNEPEKNS